jgi:uncharacterized membrane protein
MSTTIAPSSTAVPAARRSLAKPILWTSIGLAFVSVLIFTDYPILVHANDPYRARLIHDRLLIVPHALAALAAILIGPFQFSTRLRQRNLRLHRIMGRVYVGAVAIAAPTALWLNIHDGDGEAWANGTLATVWFLCTLCSFITARNRHIAVHRQWMTRSYVFTLNFIFTWVLNPIPAYFNMSEANFARMLFFLTVCYLLFTDVWFNRHELLRRRA